VFLIYPTAGAHLQIIPGYVGNYSGL